MDASTHLRGFKQGFRRKIFDLKDSIPSSVSAHHDFIKYYYYHSRLFSFFTRSTIFLILLREVKFFSNICWIFEAYDTWPWLNNPIILAWDHNTNKFV